jgi:hypothetical protein
MEFRQSQRSIWPSARIAEDEDDDDYDDDDDDDDSLLAIVTTVRCPGLHEHRVVLEGVYGYGHPIVYR